MSLFVLLVVYGFGAACIVNFFFLQVRLATANAYIARAARMRRMGDGEAEEIREKAVKEEKQRPYKVIFLHPDLGIGGAERLILDAAIGLKKHQDVHPMDVLVVTAHHDRGRCFKETVDGTVKVEVHASWLPASILGHCKVFCATLRMIFAGFMVCWSHPDVDAFVVDQVAAAMPALAFFAPCTPILFYCHFPDQKCDPNRNFDGTVKPAPPAPGGAASAVLGTTPPQAPSSAYTAYRSLFDNVEALSMKAASSIVCNSRFSCEVTKETFPEIAQRINIDEDVFYPPVAPPAPAEELLVSSEAAAELAAVKDTFSKHAHAFVSINRFERSKGILLAVEAFAELLKKSAEPSSLLLVVAGGYDSRLPENVSYYKEIEEAASGKFNIPAEQFLLLRNVPDVVKQTLLTGMRALLYTPANEHFGIVPVEAMMHSKPVIAVNHGGPCESVGDVEKSPDEAGGLLCEPKPEAFAEAMRRLVEDKALAEKLGTQGKQRALTQFSVEDFSEKMAARLVKLYEGMGPRVWETYKDSVDAHAKPSAEARSPTPAVAPSDAKKEN